MYHNIQRDNCLCFLTFCQNCMELVLACGCWPSAVGIPIAVSQRSCSQVDAFHPAPQVEGVVINKLIDHHGGYTYIVACMICMSMI